MSRARRLRLLVLAAGLGLAGGALLVGGDGPTAPRRTAGRRDPLAAARHGVARQPVPRAAVPAPVAAGPVQAVPAAATGPVPPRPGRRILFGADASPRAGDLGVLARALLDEHRDALGVTRMPGELRLVSERTTLSGCHLRFAQFVGGAEVEGAEVSTHVARDGRPLLAAADLFAVEGGATTPSIDAARATTAAREVITDRDDTVEDTFEAREPALVILPEGRGGRLAWRIDAWTADESARLWIAADGDDAGSLLATRDLRVGVDGEARVYQPNPVYSARNPALRDKNDAYSPMLDASLVTVVLPRLDGTGRVRGLWCDAARGKGDVYRPTLDWTSLTRGDDEFEHVNAYWHIDRVQQRLQDLGVTAANAEPQKVDVHALFEDQSYYDLATDTIRYGNGGVDDAEDGDIVVHEYAHAVQDAQVRGFGATDEGAAMGEGFADFLACAFHATGDSRWDPLVASWDATSYSTATPPFLRRVDRAKVYPRDVVREPHADGEIWSRFLWDLRALLGGDEAVRVSVEAHEFVSSSGRFKDGANGVLVANISLRGGADDAQIRARLRARGLPFSAEPAGPPPEDAYEENDDAAHAAPLTAGAYPGLLLADDDWYRVEVPEFRRLSARADFSAADLDLDLELRALSGALLTLTRGNGDVAVVDGVAGLGGATMFVRVRQAPGFTATGGYRLTLADLDLERVRAGRTSARRTPSGGTDAVAVTVGVNKVDAGRRLVVTSRAVGGGAVNDVRVVSPSGVTVAEFGDGRTAAGARVTIDLGEPGDWRIETSPRDGTSGRSTLQAKFR